MADAKNLIALLQLGLRCGDGVTISAEGDDEAGALARICAAVTGLSAGEKAAAKAAADAAATAQGLTGAPRAAMVAARVAVRPNSRRARWPWPSPRPAARDAEIPGRRHCARTVQA